VSAYPTSNVRIVPAPRETITLDLCEDCVYYDAYGWHERETEPLPDPKPMGSLVGYVIAHSADEEHFSWSACQGCGNPLGGARYTSTLVKP
jgi:hypothetical protein